MIIFKYNSVRVILQVGEKDINIMWCWNEYILIVEL